MSKSKVKIEITITVDTDEYQLPADGNVRLQLEEDITEAMEGINLYVDEIKIPRVNIKYDETEGFNSEEP